MRYAVKTSTLLVLALLALVGMFVLQQLWPALTNTLCLRPRTAQGLVGIFAAPLLHGDIMHLLGNLAVVIPSLWLVHELYPRVWLEVVVFGWMGTGLLVWAGARANCHIGASGLGYALTLFLFVNGLLRRDRRSWALAMLVLLLNQGWVWGMLPADPSVSWESHVLGAVTGTALAIWYRKEQLPQPVDEPTDTTPDIPDEVWDYRHHLPPTQPKEPNA